MKKMKWLYVLLATFLLTSCGTLMQPYQMDSKMKDIELGMTKKKVISILGNGILVVFCTCHFFLAGTVVDAEAYHNCTNQGESH